MRRLVVLGAGTAGTIIVNKLRRRLDARDWTICVVDRDDRHLYQPGLLFVPFGQHTAQSLTRSRHSTLVDGVDFVTEEVDRIRPDDHEVDLVSGRSLGYDVLVIATGASTRPEETPGMLGPEWRRSIFDFYTLEGASSLAPALQQLEHGRLAVHVAETPIKCPVAPLEFAFLAESWLRRRGVRDRVEISYVTPQPGAFTRPIASKLLGTMLDERKIMVETDFVVEHIDSADKRLVSYDERSVDYDLLVTVPVNMGSDMIKRSGLGDELNYVPVDHGTMQSPTHPEIFAVGDANNLPSSKAGSVAHFAAEIFVDNFVEIAAGREPSGRFDGHANCFVETGDARALLIDFNYDTEPLPGKYPLPWLGPMDLLKESRVNHLGKLGFRWLYWNVLLPGRPLPLPAAMTMAGKTVPQT